MKKILYIAFAVSLFFGACKKKTTDGNTDSKGNLTIQFNNLVDGKPLVADELNYTNAAGNKYSVSLLKYYVSNVVLIKDDNTEIPLGNYDLIDGFNPTNFSTVVANGISYGNYTGMRFYLGIDKSRNHTGAQDGDLDPMYNMIWTWSTGYLFMKHEGKFINSNNDTVNVQYHLGTDDALATITVPITLDMNSANKKLNILFDLNKMYVAPVIDFNTDNIIHSTDTADATWIQNMKANAANAFSYQSQQ